MKDQNPQHCQHVPVASSGAGRITVCCECNVVHLELEYLTLRLTPASFRAVAHLLASGVATLEQARQESIGLAAGDSATAAADGARLH